MHFQLYNTLTRQKEVFFPLEEGKVKFYSCGPTVYNTVHIGNLRSFLCADTLFRWMKYGLEYDVQWAMNITDVDDKTIRDSQKKYPNFPPMESLLKFTREYEGLFFADLEILNIPKDSFYAIPRATESVEAMQDLIRRIHDNGIAYEKDGSVYFSIEKYAKHHKYGKLVHLNLNDLKTGTRTLSDEIEKENVQDFVLWKGIKTGEPAWDFDFLGTNLPGRPGWHIECSAMEYVAFGLPFDIHSGGIDLCFPHHEDEIAQSVAGYGKEPTKYWMHNEHLLVEGEKMSKSLGNFYTLHDLLQKGHSPDALRFFLVSHQYRTKLNLSEESVKASAQGLQRIRNFCRGIYNSKERQTGRDLCSEMEKIKVAMCDDLNTPQALAVLFGVLSLSDLNTSRVIEFFRFAECIFGVRFLPTLSSIPNDVLQLAEHRKEAKVQKNFDTADKLRQDILKRGYEVRDLGNEYEIVPCQQ